MTLPETRPRVTAAGLRENLAAAVGAALRFVREQPHWTLLLIAYASAWYVPISPLWRLVQPGAAVPEGIDGPVSWSLRWWTNPASPLTFQPFVPLGVALLAWKRRERLARLWRATRQALPSQMRRWRIGSFAWLTAGLLLLIGSYLVHVATLAILGLQLVGVGIVRRVYGPLVLRGLAVPILFFLTISMPPETVPAKFQDKMAIATAQGAGLVLRALRRPVRVEGWTIIHGDSVLTVTTAGGGAALIALTLVCIFWHGLWQGRRPGVIATRLLLGLVAAVALAVGKTTLAALLHPTNPKAANVLVEIAPVLLLPVSLLGARFLMRLSRRVALRIPARVRNQARQALATLTRPFDLLMDRSGRLLGAAGNRVARVSHQPMDRGARTIGSLLWIPFRMLGRSARGLEAGFRRIEKRLQRPPRRR